jgi:hypothetical protein
LKIAHIINPVKVSNNSDLSIAQPITFESMNRAALASKDALDIQLYTTCYPEDVEIIPEYFQQTKMLDRSVLDLGQFNKKRKLPILKDILQNLFDASDAEYFIYTNVDIAVMPYFYDSVSKLLNENHDALVINRRTITDKYTEIEELPLIYAEAGMPHPGFDCFVFSRELLKKIELNSVCVGISLIGLALMLSLYRHANNFKLIEDAHLTFHMGDDQSWNNPEFNDYYEHNKQEFLKTLALLEEEYGEFDKSLPSWTYNTISAVKGNHEIEGTITKSKKKQTLKQRLKSKIHKLSR